MDDYETLSLRLPADVIRAVREAVDGKRYMIDSDVVLEALGDWQVKQHIRAAKLDCLRNLVNEGLASGFEPMASDEFDEIKREGRARMAARKAAE